VIFFHAGLVVADLAQSMEMLGAGLGLTWVEPQERRIGRWTIQVTYANEGPPYLELIGGLPDSPWIPAPGPTLHHLAYWSDDLDADRIRLDDAGLRLELDAREFGIPFTLHQPEAGGIRTEMLDSSYRPAFERRWGFA
jgi:catechol 2,3-dioxygenase-like lactoylglutathione lyase family enzyme